MAPGLRLLGGAGRLFQIREPRTGVDSLDERGTMVGMSSDPESIPDDENEWCASDETVSEAECDNCGELKPCIFSGDPFVEEICPEYGNEHSWWCRSCYVRRKDDI